MLHLHVKLLTNEVVASDSCRGNVKFGREMPTCEQKSFCRKIAAIIVIFPTKFVTA